MSPALISRHRLLPFLLLVFLLIAIWQAAILIMQDLLFTRLETEVSFWGQDTYMPSTSRRKTTAAEVAKLSSGCSVHPDYYSLQAAVASWEAYWADSEDARLAYSRQALLAQKRALESRPVHPQSWAKMLEYASRTPHGAGMIAIAQSRLAELSSTQDGI